MQKNEQIERESKQSARKVRQLRWEPNSKLLELKKLILAFKFVFED